MEDNGMTLDDLHDNDDVIVNEDTNLDEDGNPIVPADNAASADADGEGNSSDDATGEEEEDEDASLEDNETPAIEQYLAQHGIIGGMITFEDGESKHFNDLTESEKFNILHDLSSNATPENGLDQEEVSLINWLREQDVPLQESIERLAQQRVEQLLALSEAGTTNFADMSDDAVMMRSLKNIDPEASEEELAEELSKQKESRFFAKNVERLREGFVAEQQAEAANLEKQRQEAQLAEIEEDRALIANTMQNINNIAGFDINDDEKNAVLHDLLEVNQEGDSLFMEEVFGNPDNLIKAAWLYKNAEKYMDELETYYKKENARSYQAGKSDAINGLSKAPLGGVGSNNTNSASAKEPVRTGTEGYKTLDELHED